MKETTRTAKKGEWPKTDAVTVTINDHATLRHAMKRAREEGHGDWREWLREQARTGTRLAIGMQADLGTAAAARYANVHPNSLFNYHARGLLPGMYYLSARKAMWPVADLDALKQRTATIAEDARRVA